VIFDPALLDRLAALPATPWERDVYRHMFGGRPPDRVNILGARWNPPETGAIYVSLERAGALAEGDHLVAIQPLRPRATRTIYTIHVNLSNVLDLTDRALLAELGVDAAGLVADDFDGCPELGGAAAFLGHDAILVPSVRAGAANIVLYTANLDVAADLEVVSQETLPAT
jgi:RES domain-containing protein